MLVYRINFFLQQMTRWNAKEPPRKKASDPAWEKRMIEKLSQKYQAELGQLSLSQRERLVFNYINQPSGQEDLKDVNLEEVLQVPGKEEAEDARANRRKQLLRYHMQNADARVCKSKSVDNLMCDNIHSENPEPELDSREEEEEEISLGSDSESAEPVEENAKPDSLLEKLNESGEQADLVPSPEVRQPCPVPGLRRSAENMRLLRAAPSPCLIQLRRRRQSLLQHVDETATAGKGQRPEQPYESAAAVVPNPGDPVSQRIRKIKRAKVTLLGKALHSQENRSFIVPHAPNEPSPSASASALKQRPTISRLSDSSEPKKPVMMLRNPSDYSVNSPVILSKNYSDKHRELNVNISITDGKSGDRLRKHVAALIPSPQQIRSTAPPKHTSSRSYSVKNINRGPLRRLRGSVDSQARLERNGSPAAIRQREVKIKRNAVPAKSRYERGGARGSLPAKGTAKRAGTASGMAKSGGGPTRHGKV